MTRNISEFFTQLMVMLPESATELPSVVRNQIIKQAVMDYGRDRPDYVTDDVSGDGGKFYLLDGGSAVTSAWSDEFSHVVSIQYPAPAIASDEYPIYLDADDYDTSYYDASNRYLWFPNHAPAATETIRITYTTPYSWSSGSLTMAIAQNAHGFSVDDYVYEDADNGWVNGYSANLLATHQVTVVTDVDNFTIAELVVPVPEMDFFAVCNRAACLACQSIAQKYSRTSDSTISADSVNATTRAQEFRSQAREFCDLYNVHLGIMSGDDGRANFPSSDFVDLDTRPLFPQGRNFLFHGRETR